ncbi:hypothetical protein Goklo_027485 [Gossypium klotzschianum]|uniref:Macrophage migration inhibitory factor family protein n=1 Tax=Gossypium klotzschianum TaxID=34286 RepID=A0A7J8TYD5_9ROSI|nr:hypothetical protein [Gossypium klotzschianum]
MPCLNLSTNVNLDGVDTSAILSEATSSVAKLIGKPEAVRSPFLSSPSIYSLSFFCPRISESLNEEYLEATGLLLLCMHAFYVMSMYVMIVLKGSVPMSFGGTEQPAAYGELVSIGGLNPDVNKKLSAAIAAILETKLQVPKSRFFLKFYDTKASFLLLLLNCHEDGSFADTFLIYFAGFQLWMERIHLLRLACSEFLETSVMSIQNNLTRTVNWCEKKFLKLGMVF